MVRSDVLHFLLLLLFVASASLTLFWQLRFLWHPTLVSAKAVAKVRQMDCQQLWRKLSDFRYVTKLAKLTNLSWREELSILY